MLDKSSQILSLEQPCESKSLEVALNIAGVGKLGSENLRLRSNWIPFVSSFERKGALTSDVQWKFVSFVVGDSQISLKKCRRHLLSAIQLVVNCTLPTALKRTGTFVSENKVTLCVFLC